MYFLPKVKIILNFTLFTKSRVHLNLQVMENTTAV